MNQLTRIVATVVDTKKAVLYKQDGSTVEILQGDSRLRPILEHITPLLTKQGFADVDLSTPNSWKEFEEKTSGTVRFFRIAKDKLKKFFSSESEQVAPISVGNVPLAPEAKALNAIDEIAKHAVPVKAASFEESKVAIQRPTAESDGSTPNDRSNDGKDGYFDKHPETIVAVTQTGKVIPGVERIKSQFAGAVKNGNTKGLEVFLERIGAVIQKRRHTVEDLLRFLERGDLPIADDGTIVIYKRLYRKADGKYVDSHTKKVIQRVGSFVHMDEKLVDPNRRNECSNGLHVARRGYIGSFSGDVVVLAKVRPEDVIAVPNYDANKMRVCGYHIIAELTPAQFQVITSNRPISAAEGGAALLGKAIAGNHIGIIEYVKINAQQGGDLVITPAEGAVEPLEAVEADPLPEVPTKAVEPLEAAVASKDDPVDVKKVAAKAKDYSVSLDKAEPAKQVTQTDVVKAMWDEAIGGDTAKAKELLAFKKKAKKGWQVWGLPSTAGDTLKALLDD